jgi:hypothetical protein
MTRAARAMAIKTVTKRAMVTDGNNKSNGDGEEGGGQATTATMAMARGAAQTTRPLALHLGRGG